jgi:hypothetical protein
MVQDALSGRPVITQSGTANSSPSKKGSATSAGNHPVVAKAASRAPPTTVWAMLARLVSDERSLRKRR